MLSRRGSRDERRRLLFGFADLRLAQALLNGFRFGFGIGPALRPSEQQPLESGNRVLRDTEASEMSLATVELGQGITALGCELIPVSGELFVLWHPLASLTHEPKIILRGGAAFLGGFGQPSHRVCDVVGNSLPGMIMRIFFIPVSC
ncbi:MAG: hypothetical protein ABSG59_23245 [Verrucomicrobiota bacterium]|jgi:hypothetical protein